ncbi:MAG TPA: hypothetical protein VIH99_02635 [Bdellovibrionota bacterium]
MPLLAGADDTGCPAQMEKLSEPSCGDTEACNACKAAVKKEKGGSAKKYESKRATCKALQQGCSGAIQQSVTDAGRSLRFLTWLDSIACKPAFAGQAPTMENGRDTDAKGEKCLKDAQAVSSGAAGEATGCASSIRAACKGDAQQAGEKEAKKCEDAGKDAQKTADKNGEKAKEAGKQSDKNGDNAKKEGGGGGDDAKKEGGGGGGGPPPPPPPGGGDDKPPPENPAQYPQNDSGLTQNTDTSTAPAEETTSKLDEERFPSGSTFGADNAAGSKDSIAPATAALGAAGMPGWHGGSGGFNPSTDSGGGSPMNTSGASMMGSGVGGGGGGSGNSLDKATSAADLPKPEPGNNPYEINGSGGGRLGAPKGSKSGGESDSTLDASAASSFNSDVAISTDKATGDEAAPEEDDAGFTLFKMVKYRYSELKRSGHI